MKKRIFNLILCSLFCLFIAQLSLAQQFGKNKVRYKEFDWKIFQTEHFEIYHNPESTDLAKISSEMAEDAYKKISTDLRYKIKDKVPFILFKSHYEFQQTNIILEQIDRWVGGFTEIFKHRMVIPFTGSYEELNTVITHELTHVFTYNILYEQNPLESMLSGQAVSAPPMWIMEGIAEYETGKMDVKGEMVLADAVFENNIIPLEYLDNFNTTGNTYLCYKQSQSLFDYIAKTYGNDRIHLLLKKFKASSKIDKCLKSSIGIDLPTLEKGWIRYLQQKYYLRLAQLKLPTDYGNALIKNNNDSGLYTSPVFSPAGDMVALIKNELGYTSIIIVRTKDGQVLQDISKGMSGSKFEEIRFENKALSWSRDGEKIGFVAKKNGKDALFIYNLLKSELTQIIEFSELNAISGISFSPNSQRLALAGLKNGLSNIYVLELQTQKLTAITSDYVDSQPCWSSEGDYIAFVREECQEPVARDLEILPPALSEKMYNIWSNRCTNIFLVNPNTSQEYRVTQTRFHNEQPFFITQGSSTLKLNRRFLLFSSDASGIPNLYAVQLPETEVLSESESSVLASVQITDCVGGIFNFDISSQSQLIFASYYKGNQQPYLGLFKDLESQIANCETKKTGTNTQDFTIRDPRYDIQNIASSTETQISDYKTKLTFDWRDGQVLYSTVNGFLPRFSIGASDILGNHRFSLFMDKASSISESTDFLFSYLYLAKRPSYGIDIFNIFDYFLTQTEEYIERETGLRAYFNYPLSKFRRIEAGFTSEIKNRNFLNTITPIEKKEREGIDILSAGLVQDSTVWNYSGPLQGNLCRLTIEQTVPVLFNDVKFTNLKLDLRQYIKIGQESNWAFRLLSKNSYGNKEDRLRFPIGGIGFPIEGTGRVNIRQEGDLRGYKNSVWGEHLLLTNIELRTPFIKLIYFALPLAIRNIRTILFFDMGGVWNKGENLTTKNKKTDTLKDTDLRGSIGLGLRVVLGMFPLRIDYAWPVDIADGQIDINNNVVSHFSLGYDF